MLFQLLGEKIHQWPKPGTWPCMRQDMPTAVFLDHWESGSWLAFSGYILARMLLWFILLWLNWLYSSLDHVQSPRNQGISFLRVSSFTNPLRCSLVLTSSLQVSRLGKGNIFPLWLFSQPFNHLLSPWALQMLGKCSTIPLHPPS